MADTTARDAILSAIRAARPPAIAEPSVRSLIPVASPSSIEDLVARFTAAVRAAAADVVDSADYGGGTDAFTCEAVLGVAENGAVWLPASRLSSRSGFFLAEHVVVTLDRGSIVSDMHAAYERLDVAAEEFGCFVAGPSKTADIEQSLIVGAHGPKALTIVLR
jgi:L-lactate dehydrogenase complex protein LldG